VSGKEGGISLKRRGKITSRLNFRGRNPGHLEKHLLGYQVTMGGIGGQLDIEMKVCTTISE